MTQLTAKEITEIAAKALDSKKGQNIMALNTADLTSLAEYFVICTGGSSTQIKALADAVEKALSEAGEEPHDGGQHDAGQKQAHADGQAPPISILHGIFHSVHLLLFRWYHPTPGF